MREARDSRKRGGTLGSPSLSAFFPNLGKQGTYAPIGLSLHADSAEHSCIGIHYGDVVTTGEDEINAIRQAMQHGHGLRASVPLSSYCGRTVALGTAAAPQKRDAS